jgi:hypothetical protein
VRARLLAALLILACAPARAATVKLFAYDAHGRPLDLPGLLARLGRADDRTPRDPSAAPFWAFPTDGKTPPQRVTLAQAGPLLTAAWDGGPARLELVWPTADDGYGDVWADNGGHGFGDGDAVFLDEEIAKTQYRLFKDSWRRRTTDWEPLYEPGRRAKKLADAAKDAIAAATRRKSAPKRAAAFEKALHAVSIAWEKELFEHGLQLAAAPRLSKDARFGLTLDASLVTRMDDLKWIVEGVKNSGSNWVRVVFRPNPSDFLYASLGSFNEYDGAIKLLRDNGIQVMGDVLDTAQWPRKMTPEIYAERVKNLVLHYKGRVAAWEVGPELNGDWFGGSDHPLTPDQVFRIYSAGAAKVKELDPQAQTVATLYWWEATAPDREHSTSGWLQEFVPKGFGTDLDAVGVELFPNDNPVGMGFERAFDQVFDALPRQTLFLSSFGFVEKDKLNGYWWLSPDDVDGARKDLMILYTTASCAMRGSVCGGFWWQTLDQMLPARHHHRSTDLYKVYRRTLAQLGRRD